MLSLLRRPGAAAATLVCVAALYCAPLVAETLTGRVVGIADGDTLTLLDSSNRQHRIRLSGIDAPRRSNPLATSANRTSPA